MGRQRPIYTFDTQSWAVCTEVRFGVRRTTSATSVVITLDERKYPRSAPDKTGGSIS